MKAGLHVEVNNHLVTLPSCLMLSGKQPPWVYLFSPK